MCRVTFKGANLLKMLLVTTAAMLAICLLALVETTNTAEATSLPQNGKIAFMSDRDDNYEIYTMNADGSRQTNITENLADDWWPFWSPDGTKMAFNSKRDGDRDVYIMNADGSEQARLTDNAAAEPYLDWSPDGTKIAFNGRRDANNQEIYTMNADGSNVARLTNNSAIEYLPDWQPLPSTGPSLLLVAGALLVGVGVLLYALVKR